MDHSGQGLNGRVAAFFGDAEDQAVSEATLDVKSVLHDALFGLKWQFARPRYVKPKPCPGFSSGSKANGEARARHDMRDL